MRRREILKTASVTGFTLSTAGCLSFTDHPGDSEGPLKPPTTIETHSFKITEEAPETSIQSVESSTITIVGTVTVQDGCTTIVMGSEPTISDSRTVKAMVGTRQTGSTENQMCTQATRDLGYILDFTYQGTPPETIQIGEAGVNSESHTLTVPEE